MKLTAAMIVKNEEACLENCLKSIQGIDEIVIADTGSTDFTIEIAKKYTNKVFTDYKWEDSFAKARNHALSKVDDGSWVLSIDADETLLSGGLELLKSKLAALKPEIVSVGITLRAQGSGHETVAPRVFKKHPDVFWQGAAHNYLTRRAQVAYPEIVIEYGYSPTHKADPDRTLRILRKAVEENPDKPREMYYLAREYWYRKQYQIALNHYTQYLKIASWPPEKADAYLMSAKCLLNLKRLPEAKDICIMAIRTQPPFKEAFEFMASVAEDKDEKIQWLRYAIAATNKEVLFVRTKPVYNTSIIIPTKNSATLQACVETVMKTTICPTEIIVVNSGFDPINMEGTREIFVPDTTTLTEQIKIGLDSSRSDFVTAFCDDHFPQVGWLEIAFHAFNGSFPDGLGVVCLNEGIGYRGSKACVTLTNKATIERLLGGVWYDTLFYQYRCDVDLAMRASKTSKYVYCDEAVVHHDHKGASGNMSRWWEHDAKVFDERWKPAT